VIGGIDEGGCRQIFSDRDVQERLTKEIINDRLYGVQYWPIFVLRDGTHVGACGIRPYGDAIQRQPHQAKVYEIGFHIRSKHWREGFAKEAAAAVMRYAFERLKVGALFAGHHPDNQGSRQLLLKLCFRYTHDEYYKPTGLQHPSYRMTSEEYFKQQTELMTKDSKEPATARRRHLSELDSAADSGHSAMSLTSRL